MVIYDLAWFGGLPIWGNLQMWGTYTLHGSTAAYGTCIHIYIYIYTYQSRPLESHWRGLLKNWRRRGRQPARWVLLRGYPSFHEHKLGWFIFKSICRYVHLLPLAMCTVADLPMKYSEMFHCDLFAGRENTSINLSIPLIGPTQVGKPNLGNQPNGNFSTSLVHLMLQPISQYNTNIACKLKVFIPCL